MSGKPICSIILLNKRSSSTNAYSKSSLVRGSWPMPGLGILLAIMKILHGAKRGVFCRLTPATVTLYSHPQRVVQCRRILPMGCHRVVAPLQSVPWSSKCYCLRQCEYSHQPSCSTPHKGLWLSCQVPTTLFAGPQSCRAYFLDAQSLVSTALAPAS